MAHDVYLVGLFDDSMTYFLLTKEEFDKTSLSAMQEQDFQTFIAWDLLEYMMSPEEFAEYKAANWGTDGSGLVGSEEDAFNLDQILELVKLGKINVLGTAEGLQL